MSAADAGRDVVAAMADLIVEGDDRADIYSMVRLRKGYGGYCRRVRRAADNATLDVGFTTDGAYDLEAECAWAGDSDVYLVRWYNQSAAAGNTRPSCLQTHDAPSAPRTQSGGNLIRLGALPAILMQSESWLASAQATRISQEGGIAVIWIGSASVFDHGDAGLWSIHEEGIDDARTCEVDGFEPAQVRDRGIYYDRAARFDHPTGDFTALSMIVTSNPTETPWPATAWVNGQDRSATFAGSVSGIGVGAPQLLGANVVHTFIVDGARESPIAAIAKAAFNARGWIW